MLLLKQKNTLTKLFIALTFKDSEEGDLSFICSPSVSRRDQKVEGWIRKSSAVNHRDRNALKRQKSSLWNTFFEMLFEMLSDNKEANYMAHPATSHQVANYT